MSHGELCPRYLYGHVKEEDCLIAAFDLILSLYGIGPTDQAVADLRDSLCEPRMMR